MRSYLSTWSSILTKLGFTRKKSRLHSSGRNVCTRKLHFEQCEDRLLLTTFTVNNIGDTNAFDLNDNVSSSKFGNPGFEPSALAAGNPPKTLASTSPAASADGSIWNY